MDLQTRKIEFVQEFLKLQNDELITRLERLLRSGKATKNNDLKPMTITELNKRIDKSMEGSEGNRLTTSSDLLAEIENWK